jgi:hypothetical protein
MKFSSFGPNASGMRLKVVTDSMSPAESPINESRILWLVALMKNTSAAPKVVLMPVRTMNRIT